ncbi:MAG: energy transducer TonB [Gammaproteobacteria bacterium]|nr:energy transducer TonB [Gammaproteobacteria bacterium]
MSVTATLPLPAPVTAYDRLGLTLFFAVVVHALLILGVRFDLITLPLKNPFPSMEITLVDQRTPDAPAHADFLAQAQQQGGGNVDTPTPLTPPPAAQPAPQEPAAAAQPQPEITPVQPTPKNRLTAKTPTPREAIPDEAASVAPAETPSAAELVARSMQIDSLSAALDESRAIYAKRPRQTFISAATREYKYASYMEAWRRKVETIGNLNYPDEARRRNLSGSLILDVALNTDGSINNITLRRSSGHRVLDDAAIAIVRLAAPFAEFPDNIRKETDVLHITRTWQFLRGNRLSGGG